jgi:hypothetical protein
MVGKRHPVAPRPAAWTERCVHGLPQIALALQRRVDVFCSHFGVPKRLSLRKFV